MATSQLIRGVEFVWAMNGIREAVAARHLKQTFHISPRSRFVPRKTTEELNNVQNRQDHLFSIEQSSRVSWIGLINGVEEDGLHVSYMTLHIARGVQSSASSYSHN